MKKAYYAIIPANVRYDKDLTPNAKLLYGEITALCNEKGFCWASNSYFANLYEVSNKSVSTWINQLAERGYVKTQLIYAKGTKEVRERRIYLSDTPIEEIFHTPRREVPHPIEENFHTPMEEKVKDNNTSINNTINNTTNRENSKKDNIKLIISEWNKLELQEIRSINKNTKRYSMLKTRIDEYSIDEVVQAIKSIDKSSFLKGKNDRGWTITFDWLVRPNNFIKVLEGNYIDKGDKDGKGAEGVSGENKVDWAERAGVQSF